MSSSPTNVALVDLDKLEPTNAEIMADRQKNAIFSAACGGILGATGGFFAAKHYKFQNLTANLAAIGLTAGCAAGGYWVGKVNKTEREVVNEMISEALKQNKPEEALKEAFVKYKNQKDMEESAMVAAMY